MDLKHTLKRYLTLIIFAITSIAFSQTNEEKKIANYIKLAKEISNTDIAAQDSLLNLAVKLCKKTNNDRLQAECLLKRISVLQNIGDYETANALNKEVYTLCKNKNFKDLRSECVYNTGINFMLNNENVKAIEKLNECSNLFLKEKNYKKYIAATANLGWTYGQNKNYISARHYLKEALEYAKKYTPNRLGGIYEKLAIQYAKDKYEFKDTAIMFFKLAENEYAKSEDLYGLANIYNNLGSTYQINNQYEKALSNYNLALENYKKIGLNYADKEIYMNLGVININLENLVIAEKYLNQSLQIAQAENDRITQTELEFNFGYLNEKKGDYKSATELYKQYIKDYFLNYSEQQTEEINKLTANNEIVTRENKLILLKKEQAELHLNYFVMSAIALGILLLGIFIIFFFYKKTQQDNKMLKADFEQKSITLVKDTSDEERKRISRDLHDNIGSYAVSILNNIELLDLQQSNEELEQRLSEIKSNASNVLNSIRETITVLNDSEFTLIKILDSFKSYATNILKNHPQILFKVEEEIIEDKIYNSIDAVNLSYMLKELFNNTIKHAHCKNINFSIKETEGLYKIEFGDDGKGFDMKNYEPKNGMENLNYRADKSNFQFTMQSSLALGTTATIVF